MGVSWKHGFQDASMQELTAAMDLSKPSRYAAFGDKESLNLKTLEPYGRRAVGGFLRSLATC